jgi:exo-beta-1,3-glucanase (GH17 family)
MSSLPFSTAIGVNFSNTFQSNPVPNSQAASDIGATGIKPVKMFNYDQSDFFADALAQGLELVPGVPNADLAALAAGNTAALAAVVNALSPYKANIKAIMVGNEPLISAPATYGPLLAPALTNLHAALVAAGINVPLSVPFNSGIESVSWPPSAGAFNLAYSTYLTDVCTFLQNTNSFFTINIYPYYAHINDPTNVPLAYCLFTNTQPQFTDPANNLPYYNVFDAQYDATVSALSALGFSCLPLVVGETGWPSANGLDATVANAQTFNQNLINHVNSGNGSPANPTAVLQTFIFEMYDENEKTGAAFEPDWGVYQNSSGNTYTAKYTLSW